MMRRPRPAASALAIGALLTLAPTANSAQGPKPGMWKVVTHVTRDGATMPPDSHTSCVTADQMKDPGQSIMPHQASPDEKCTRTQYEWTGSKLSWQIECSGQMNLKGAGKINFDRPERYSGEITSAGSVNGHDFNSTIVLEGQRVGDCPK
jgi:Protein of unknown function (DUF3617)